MHKQEYTNRQVAQIVKRANHIPLTDVWSELVDDVLSAECNKAGTCKEFLLCPLMSAVSLYLGSATIQTFPDTPDGLCMYTALAAFPSTGKTNAMNKVKTSFEKVEKFMNLADNDSQIINAPTVEGLFDLLGRLKHVIGFFDEGGLFFGALGRYGSGGDKSGYDRSVYLNLWNAPLTIERDLKTEGRCKLHMVRLMLALLTHPKTMVNLIKNEQVIVDDGFSHRFNTCSPEPANVTAEDIRSACSRRSIIPLEAIFLFIKLMHTYPRLYKFSEEAEKVFDAIFNRFKRFVKFANFFDSFLGGVFGKCATHIVRNCLFIQALTVAINSLKEMPIITELTDQLRLSFEEIISKSPATTFIIDASIVKQAINLNSFFLMNKLVLGTYDVVSTNDVFEEIESLLARENDQPQVRGDFVTIHPNILEIMGKILFAKDTKEPYPSDVGSHNLKSNIVEEAMNKLVFFGIGSVIADKAGNNRKTIRYIKPTMNDLINNSQIARKIQDMGCDLDEYKKHVSELEGKPNVSQAKANKRKKALLDTRENKKPRKESLLQQTVVDEATQLPRVVNFSPTSKRQLKHGSTYMYQSTTTASNSTKSQKPKFRSIDNHSQNEYSEDHENESDVDLINTSSVQSKNYDKSKSKINRSTRSNAENDLDGSNLESNDVNHSFGVYQQISHNNEYLDQNEEEILEDNFEEDELEIDNQIEGANESNHGDEFFPENVYDEDEEIEHSNKNKYLKNVSNIQSSQQSQICKPQLTQASNYNERNIELFNKENSKPTMHNNKVHNNSLNSHQPATLEELGFKKPNNNFLKRNQSESNLHRITNDKSLINSIQQCTNSSKTTTRATSIEPKNKKTLQNQSESNNEEVNGHGSKRKINNQKMHPTNQQIRQPSPRVSKTVAASKLNNGTRKYTKRSTQSPT